MSVPLAELERFLKEEVLTLTEATATTYRRYVVEPFEVSVTIGYSDVTMFVVAQSGDEVLYYDHIEEEFGTGKLDNRHHLTDHGTWGERLEWALRHFPSGR